jgi:hypothetical protein
VYIYRGEIGTIDTDGTIHCTLLSKRAAASLSEEPWVIHPVTCSSVGLLGLLGVQGGGNWPSSWALEKMPGAVAAPSISLCSASTNSSVLLPHWQVACEVEVRGGRLETAQGELAGSDFGVVAPLAGAVMTVGKVVDMAGMAGVKACRLGTPFRMIPDGEWVLVGELVPLLLPIPL